MRNHWTPAASTLGVIDETFEQTIDMLAGLGVTAMELRSAPGAFVHCEMTPAERQAALEKLHAAGIEAFAVASVVRIVSPGDDEPVIQALTDELRLAKDLGARFVRVFPGAQATVKPFDQLPAWHEDREPANQRAVRRFLAVQEAAKDLGVCPVLETHDSHPRGEDVAGLLGALDEADPSHCVGAIWDVLHPWRVGEPLSRTAECVLPYVLGGRGYVQIKDVADPATCVPVLQGTGKVPVPEFLGILSDAGYSGPVSLEWERFWHPQVEPLSDAMAAAQSVLEENPPR